MTLKHLKVHPLIRPFYDYLVYNGRLVDIKDFDEGIMNIFSREVLRQIRSGEPGWEDCLPAYVDNIIKEKKLFGYKPSKKEAAQV